MPDYASLNSNRRFKDRPNSTSTPVQLLDLAQELKNDIYAHALYTPYWLTHRSGGIRKKHNTALLPVSRQVSKDCLAIFYAINTFDVRYMWDFSFRLANPDQLGLIRDVRIDESKSMEWMRGGGIWANLGDYAKMWRSHFTGKMFGGDDRGHGIFKVGLLVNHKRVWLSLSQIEQEIEWRAYGDSMEWRGGRKYLVWKK